MHTRIARVAIIDLSQHADDWSQEHATMTITTKLQPRWAAQKLGMAILCFVLGLWGAYDYWVRIPDRIRAFERGEVYRLTNDAITLLSGEKRADPETRQTVTAAVDRLNKEIQPFVDLGKSESGPALDAAALQAALKARNDEQWFTELLIMRAGLQEAAARPSGATASEQFTQFFTGLQARVSATGKITRPAAFDHAMQWAFILCLPFAPWMAWQFVRARGRVYTLESDGTLKTPEGTFPAEQVTDVDMSRWMSKSIFEVVMNDGKRVAIDDYVHKNAHLIAGTLASARYPGQWTAEAKRVKTEAEPPKAESVA